MLTLFRSRKFQLAISEIVFLILFTIFGDRLDLTQETVAATIGGSITVVTAVIVGIAIEDHGQKSNPSNGTQPVSKAKGR
jgi:hypothetical protein